MGGLLKPLKEIEVRAVDSQGQVGIASVGIYLLQRPLTLTAPQDGFVTAAASVTVSGELGDNGLRILINGQTVRLRGLVWRQDYLPFGEQIEQDRAYQYAETHGLTGKDYDPETGLYYYNARWYDSDRGGFITVDPAKQGFNWYIYCANNPLKYTDPDGRWFGIDDIVTGPVDEAIVLGTLAILAATGNQWAQQNQETLWNSLQTVFSRSNTESKKEEKGKLSQEAKRRLAKELGGIPKSAQPTKQGKYKGTRWWEYKDSKGKTKIIVEHPDGTVHVGTPKPQSTHHQGGPPKYYPIPGTGHIGE